GSRPGSHRWRSGLCWWGRASTSRLEADTDRFFFQAEDGIRGGHVTGVQTCALPIWFWSASGRGVRFLGADQNLSAFCQAEAFYRSEERRVGKECRTRGSPEP